MKKVFTLALVMAMAVTSFAQVKGIQRKAMKDMTPSQTVAFTGMEDQDSNFPASTRSIMSTRDQIELSFSSYDWQTNAASRNFTAVWPDGFAVMCYTQATAQSFGDRGTGLAVWDPAVGEWDFTEERMEDEKTGFGAISRWGQNGLVIAAHTATECKLYFCDDFKIGNREITSVVTLPNELEPTWPCVQVSGENLDIVHVLASQYSSTDPFENAIRYYRYENGQFTVDADLLDALSYDHMGGGGSNITYFLPYDPEKPNRVSFVVNDAWVDGKVVISEDNGATWSEKVFYQHPGIHTDFTDVQFFYPRWVSAQFDDNDNLNIVYEWNGSTGVPGSGSYYPTVGGVGFWSETLPKNEMCIGGIGEVGGPFIMDTTYMSWDLYRSEWYWSDAEHDPLPEYFGELMILDENYNVIDYNGEMPEVYYWIDLSAKEHGAYNSGIAAFPSIYKDGDRVFAFWSMIAGDGVDVFYQEGNNQYRSFAARSLDGGQTWNLPVHLETDDMSIYDEMVYGQVIPYIYSDNGGEYLWYVFQHDQQPGTFVQGDESVWDDNFYHAIKVYVETLGVDEPEAMTVATTINVYPNPAQGSFNVTLNNESNVSIYNTVGQLVKTYNNVKEVNVNLESGVYFVNAGNQTVKVVVK